MENCKTGIKTRKYGFMLAAALLMFAAAAYISWQVGSVYDCGVTPLDRCVQDWFFSLRSQWLNTLIIPLTHTSDTITIVVLCIILVLSPACRRLLHHHRQPENRHRLLAIKAIIPD